MSTESIQFRNLYEKIGTGGQTGPTGPAPGNYPYTVIFSTPGVTGWVVPGGSQIHAEIWGAGGGGGSGSLSGGVGQGGGAGAYISDTLTVFPGMTLEVTVGAGGTGGSGGSGGNGGPSKLHILTPPLTYWIDRECFGGGGGITSGTTSGNGGIHSGESAGAISSDGDPGTLSAGGSVVPPGIGGTGGAVGNPGENGASPGGGGGGGLNVGVNTLGGNGANGRIVIGYTSNST